MQQFHERFEIAVHHLSKFHLCRYLEVSIFTVIIYSDIKCTIFIVMLYHVHNVLVSVACME